MQVIVHRYNFLLNQIQCVCVEVRVAIPSNLSVYMLKLRLNPTYYLSRIHGKLVALLSTLVMYRISIVKRYMSTGFLPCETDSATRADHFAITALSPPVIAF